MVANNEEEKKLCSQGYNLICGIDESGMGSFSGDVYVGLVVFAPDIEYKNLMPGLNDSKQKTPKQRDVLYEQIHKYALDYMTATASIEEIDRLNIYWARFLAVIRALNAMRTKPDYILIDGNKVIPSLEAMSSKIISGYKDSPEKMQLLLNEIKKTTYSFQQHAIVKGDSKSISIAAASILAKVERDKHIDALAELVHEDYEWKKNKSYYSPEHVIAIKKHGKTQWHRQKYVSKYFTDQK
jgi:ribonuclease HII